MRNTRRGRRRAGPSDHHGFGRALAAILPTAKLAHACAPRRTNRGRPPELDRPTLIRALVFHFMHAAGTFAEHLLWLSGMDFAESALSDRRAALPWEVFARLLRHALRPRARPRRQATAFWRGLRLLALDGTQWSLTNTPQNQAGVPKAKTRRGRAAFAKLGSAVLLEIGLHNPLAAAIARHGESEWALGLGLLAQLPRQALLLADKLYGCAAFADPLLARCQALGSHFLVRVRRNVQTKVVRRYRDGSALVAVPVRAKGNPNKIIRTLQVREILVRVQRKGHRAQSCRLWTSLLDAALYPADELGRLYAQRWEHELYYRQIKLELRKGEVLQSHTPETAAQEVAAIILCSALLAHERARAANGEVPVLSISFVKTLELLRPLWLVLALGADLLSERQQRALVERFLQMCRRMVKPKRRSRSCPRAVRQPVTGWPRLLQPDSQEGPLLLRVLRVRRST